MSGLQENTNAWIYCVSDSNRFEKTKLKELHPDVKLLYGKVKGFERWEIQEYIFSKQTFKAEEQVKTWLDTHMKNQIQTLLDFKTWNEYRRRVANAYMKISSVR